LQEEYFTKRSTSKDGFYYECKKCKNKKRRYKYEYNSEKFKKYYKKNKKKYKSYYLNNKQKIKNRIKNNKDVYDEYYNKNREKIILRQKEWNKKNRNKIEKYRITKRNKYPGREAARIKLYEAIKSGIILKPKICMACGFEFKKYEIQGHHEDYNKPLKVIWLCPKDHVLLHNKYLFF
jgi:predicted Zn-ribbon and HTH transcriptional regulator